MSKFLSRRFSSLVPYTPGEQPRDMEYVKLNTNESPFEPSPKVIEAVNSEEVKKLNLYPDPTASALTKKLAEFYGVEKKNVILSNGSDDILNFSFMAFCDSENGAIFPEITSTNAQQVANCLDVVALKYLSEPYTVAWVVVASFDVSCDDLNRCDFDVIRPPSVGVFFRFKFCQSRFQFVALLLNLKVFVTQFVGPLHTLVD